MLLVKIPPQLLVKVCNVCGVEKPVDAFYFKMRKASRRPACSCKECFKKREIKDYPNRRIKKQEAGRAWYQKKQRNEASNMQGMEAEKSRSG